jgi:PadR family transcriptional regulator PadR
LAFMRILVRRICSTRKKGEPMDILTKLEELILLSVWRIGDNAYGTTVYKYIVRVTGKKISLGGVYFPLDRLTKKGYLSAYTGDPTPERKGLSKRYYRVTKKGFKALKDIKRVNEIMWAGFPDLALSVSEVK